MYSAICMRFVYILNTDKAKTRIYIQQKSKRAITTTIINVNVKCNTQRSRVETTVITNRASPPLRFHKY